MKRFRCFGRPAVLALGFALNVAGCNLSSTASSSGAGAAARDFLSSSTYSSLKVVIQAVSGFAPTAGAQNQLVQFLETYLNKPGGITVQVDTNLTSPGQSSFSLDEVRAIESAHRNGASNGSEAVAYFLFLDGDYKENSGSNKILGIAHGPTSIVIFEKTLHDLSGGLGQPARQDLEAAVMEHEFGHLLGLVNTGTNPQTPHQDSSHGAHCTEQSCLMFWQVDTSDFISNLLGGSVPTLDANCISDLRANGGK